MNRKAIRDYLDFLIDEFDIEEDEGLFTAENKNTLINISQNRVLLDLGKYAPNKFRKTKLISIAANKREYSIVSDLAITDFLAFNSIVHNVSGKRPTPLIEIDVEDEWLYEDEEELSYWGYEDKDNIFIGPKSSGTTADRLKSFYFPELADMTKDSDEPAMPIICRPLIAIDVLRIYTVTDEGSLSRVEVFYQTELMRTVEGLSMKSNFRATGLKPSIKEVIGSRDA